MVITIYSFLVWLIEKNVLIHGHVYNSNNLWRKAFWNLSYLKFKTSKTFWNRTCSKNSTKLYHKPAYLLNLFRYNKIQQNLSQTMQNKHTFSLLRQNICNSNIHRLLKDWLYLFYIVLLSGDRSNSARILFIVVIL